MRTLKKGKRLAQCIFWVKKDAVKRFFKNDWNDSEKQLNTPINRKNKRNTSLEIKLFKFHIMVLAELFSFLFFFRSFKSTSLYTKVLVLFIQDGALFSKINGNDLCFFDFSRSRRILLTRTGEIKPIVLILNETIFLIRNEALKIFKTYINNHFTLTFMLCKENNFLPFPQI